MRVPERLGDLRVGVLRVEDVMVEIGADRDGLERDVAQVNERVGREVSLRDREVLEVEVGHEVEQHRPVGTAAGAHRANSSSDPEGTRLQRPSRRTCPRWETRSG